MNRAKMKQSFFWLLVLSFFVTIVFLMEVPKAWIGGAVAVALMAVFYFFSGMAKPPLRYKWRIIITYGLGAITGLVVCGCFFVPWIYGLLCGIAIPLFVIMAILILHGK